MCLPIEPIKRADEIKPINITYYATFIIDGCQHTYQYIVLGCANRLPPLVEYWSSTEDESNTAWTVATDGVGLPFNKHLQRYVRVVRAF